MKDENNETDWTSGIVSTDGGEILAYPNLTVGAFLASPIAERAIDDRIVEEDPVYVVDNVIIDGVQCEVRIEFSADVVRFVSIIVDHSYALSLGIQINELLIEFNSAWIRRNIKKVVPSKFSWGWIPIPWNTETLESYIMLVYEEPKQGISRAKAWEIFRKEIGWSEEETRRVLGGEG